MDWLFDNLGKLAPVVIFIIYMISSLKKKGGEEEEAFDPEAAERARRIQEEIRRKILERQRAGSPATGRPPVERPVYREEPEVVYRAPEPVRREAPVRSVEPTPWVDLDSDSSSDRYDELQKQLAAAEKLRDSTMSKAAAFGSRVPVLGSRPQSDLQRSLRAGLASPDSLKTSVLLMEVLGKPVGLR